MTCLGVWGLGVWGLGFKGLRFRDLGSRVWGLGFRGSFSKYPWSRYVMRIEVPAAL